MGGSCSAYVVEERWVQGLVGKPEGKRPLGDTGTDGKIILRWTFRKCDVELWTGSSWLGIGTVGGNLYMP
jgi:hypothetical protein